MWRQFFGLKLSLLFNVNVHNKYTSAVKRYFTFVLSTVRRVRHDGLSVDFHTLSTTVSTHWRKIVHCVYFNVQMLLIVRPLMRRSLSFITLGVLHFFCSKRCHPFDYVTTSVFCWMRSRDVLVEMLTSLIKVVHRFSRVHSSRFCVFAALHGE